jgi:hypothetical protein
VNSASSVYGCSRSSHTISRIFDWESLSSRVIFRDFFRMSQSCNYGIFIMWYLHSVVDKLSQLSTDMHSVLRVFTQTHAQYHRDNTAKKSSTPFPATYIPKCKLFGHTPYSISCLLVRGNYMDFLCNSWLTLCNLDELQFSKGSTLFQIGLYRFCTN